jgi:hypothetical protein
MKQPASLKSMQAREERHPPIARFALNYSNRSPGSIQATIRQLTCKTMKAIRDMLTQSFSMWNHAMISPMLPPGPA